jgi:Protein-glutamine gamma-glutamyltransferase
MKAIHSCIIVMTLTWGFAVPFDAYTQVLTQGLVFSCDANARNALATEMRAYLRELHIDPAWIEQTEGANQQLSFTLKTSSNSTLDLVQRKALHISTEQVLLKGPNIKPRKVSTVSKKEILLALLHPGRTTYFGGDSCDINALREHIGVRQSIVAWAEQLNWVWPDGGESKWNPSRWFNGTPQDLTHIDEALLDAFVNQQKYAFGCYTASKLSYAHGILNYYQHVLQSPEKAQLVRQRLLNDLDPLVNIEPSDTWNFDTDHTESEASTVGKLLTIQRGISSKHFVPGDWSYFQNTDPASHAKTGYEGSNVIYLGRGKFDDFYDDHRHAYTLEEKLDEVYQWRYGVFSRSADAKKAHPLSARDYERLSRNTEQGGLLRDFRLVPYLFGYETLPNN